MSTSRFMASGSCGAGIGSERRASDLSLKKVNVPSADYCREIESYLCRKNDGHVIRVVGPSFELVSKWEEDGIPLKVAFRGIDRHFERYYRKGPRRRPVRIDFCEADVLDVFSEWRRALGLPLAANPSTIESGDDAPNVTQGRRGPSLATHLTRALLRLSNARASGALDADTDALIDRIAQELETARGSARGLRGEARRAVLDRLAELDRQLLDSIRAGLTADVNAALEAEAEEELAGFRATMPADAFRRAREGAIHRLLRERLSLPEVAVR